MKTTPHKKTTSWLRLRRFVLPLAASCILGLPPAGATVLLQDDFESGDFSAWSQNTNVSASTERAASGTYSARFAFRAAAQWDALAELRFDLGSVYQEVWIQYKLYIPTNYTYRNNRNNKFIRLWATTYNDKGKVGASTWGGYSGFFPPRLRADWDVTGGGVGEGGQNAPDFITAADRGKWMTIKIHYKPALSPTQLGTLSFWKNGVQIINNTNNVTNYYASDTAHGVRYGYLLGSANTGFDEDTFLHIDDVIIATTEADLGGVSGAPEVNVLGNSTAIADGNMTPAISNGTHFESHHPTGHSLTKTYTIQNVGSAILTVNPVTLSGTNASDFTVVTQPASTVAPGGSTTFSVKFDPGALGERNAVVSFGNNDSDENPYNFAVKGRGDIVVDNTDPSGVTRSGSAGGAGNWAVSTSNPGSFFGTNYWHDGNNVAMKGQKWVLFSPNLATSGQYEVSMRWTAHANRATNVPVDVSAGGVVVDAIEVDQKRNGGIWNPLGIYTFNAGTGGSVLIGTAETNGHVVADAVKFTPVSVLTLQSWMSSPWNGVNGSTAFSASFSPDGKPVTLTFANPKKGVNISNPAAPNANGASTSFFGFEGTGFGVGDTGNVGRFNCGESLTLTATRPFILHKINWREHNGDEVLHIQWTQAGVTQQDTFAMTTNPSFLTNVQPDANTPVTITNVSPDTNANGRLRFNYITIALPH